MGLSGRKVKQRISADPRNLGWADDAARFGSSYLSKFGWDASKGLGASGDGMKSHIKVSHKLDMLGIGAAQTKDPNGIAWKQNRDFENLLQRLNEKLEPEQKPAADKTEESAAEENMDIEDGEKKKKRKHKETVEEDVSERKKKKKKKKKHGKDKERDAEESGLTAEAMQVDTVVETKTAAEVRKVAALPRHRAHRARLIAAKNIASKSAAHISEILGVAPNPQVEVNSVEVPGKLTTVTETDALGMDKLTTSTKSLADYFKEKLNARMGSSSGTSTPTAARADIDDAYDAPRGGIGASRIHLEIQSETKIEEETQRVGLSKFSSLMSSSFLAATASISYVPPQTEQDGEILDKVQGVAHTSDADPDTEIKEKSKKEKKKKEKRTKGRSEEEVDNVERKKKSKKDKKGKGKAIEEVEEVDSDTREGEKKGRQKVKKEKREKAAEEALKVEGTENDVEESTRKKEKKKHKLKKSDATSAGPEDSGKSKKEKKMHRTDS